MEKESFHILELLKNWLYSHGIKILVIILVAVLLIKLTRLIGQKIIEHSADQDQTAKLEREKRTKTLVNIVTGVTKVFFTIIILFMILREFGLDITPLLAGAGVLGLAIGFGAQNLIKDFLSGFFILLENQFRTGDVIKIKEHAGLVEDFNLRRTVLRDLEGAVHIIPNGEITTLTNLSYGWSRVVLDIGVAYKENLDNVFEALKRAAEELKKDSKVKQFITEEVQILGVEKFEDSQVTVRLIVKTLPLKQWDVVREFRKKIKEVFDKEKIEIPFPHRVVFTRIEE